MGMEDAITNHVVVIDGAVYNVKNQSNNILLTDKHTSTLILVVNYPP